MNRAATLSPGRGRWRQATSFLARLAICLGVAGCAHRTAEPLGVAQRFARAVTARDWAGAYAFMSGAYRHRVPLTAFRADLEAEAPTVATDAALLARVPARATRAEILMADGQRLVLVWEDAGGWKLDVHPIQPFAQHSPRAALRSFVRAVEGRRYDVLLRLVPARRRVGVDVENLRAFWEGPGAQPHQVIVRRLRSNLEAPIVELGTEANMPFGNSGSPGDADEGEVHFLLEDGLWKIDDVR